MKVLVIYDIPDDRVRVRVADRCKDYGLERIQFSAFFGDLDRNRREELLKRMGRELGRKSGDIRMFPLCEKDAGLVREIRRNYEPKDKGDEKDAKDSADNKKPTDTPKKKKRRSGRSSDADSEMPVLPPVDEKGITAILKPWEVPIFSREPVEDLCGEQPSLKAVEYIDTDKMTKRTFTGKFLKARIQGRDPEAYDTSIIKTGPAPQGMCTCPARGYPCKHVVALGHTWLKAPGTFEVRRE